MNLRPYANVSQNWNDYSRRTRRSVARGVMQTGAAFGKWAEDFAFWIDPSLKDDEQKTEIQGGGV